MMIKAVTEATVLEILDDYEAIIFMHPIDDHKATLAEHGFSTDDSMVRKIYTNTQISGNANVHLGDIIHIHQYFEAARSRPLQRSYVGPRGITRSLLQTTKSSRKLSVSPLFAVISDKVIRKRKRGKEICHLRKLSIFGRFAFYFGHSVDMTGDLRIYRPRMRNIVRDDAAIMSACYTGDVSRVRQLLNKKVASVHDVTANDMSPLSRAIDGRQAAIVELLLSCGADPNQPTGEHHTSPLSWALYERDQEMVRLLINAGADMHYISSRGWSILYHLWVDEKTLRPSCLDLLETLQTYNKGLMDFSDECLVDDHGWSLLSRVACTGTADEVDFLIRNGADVYWKNEHGWDAMLDSVYGGKLDVLHLLSAHVPQWLTYQDARGYSALHIAAEEGHDHIVRHLLSKGADWQLRSHSIKCPRTGDLLPGLTPADTARAESPSREQRFLELVNETEAGRTVAVTNDIGAFELAANELPHT